MTWSPNYPQWNGLVERTVQTAKQLLKKAKAGNKDPYISLLEYRNPQVDGFATPAQLLMSRRLRSILPTTKDHLKAEVVDPNKVHESRKRSQATQQHYYNRGAKELAPLESGDRVRIQTKLKTWKLAAVVKKEDRTRSYTVRTDDGGEYRRNRRFLMEAHDRPLQQLNCQEAQREQCNTTATAHVAEEHSDRVETAPSCSGESTAEIHMRSTSNSPCMTRSSRVVRPPEKLDL